MRSLSSVSLLARSGSDGWRAPRDHYDALNVDDTLELRYRFSVIGFAKIGGGGYGGSAVAFRYRSPTMSFDPAAPGFSVHLGLKESLELVEAGE